MIDCPQCGKSKVFKDACPDCGWKDPKAPKGKEPILGFRWSRATKTIFLVSGMFYVFGAIAKNHGDTAAGCADATISLPISIIVAHCVGYFIWRFRYFSEKAANIGVVVTLLFVLVAFAGFEGPGVKEKRYVSMAIREQKKGNIELAIQHCTTALEINPKSIHAFTMRCSLNQAKGNHEAAIGDCTKALEIDPTFAAAYIGRGNAQIGMESPEKAIIDYNMAIQYKPNKSETFAFRSFAYFITKEYEKAWQDVEKARELGFQQDLPFLDELKKQIEATK